MRNNKTHNNHSTSAKEDRWSWSGGLIGYTFLLFNICSYRDSGNHRSCRHYYHLYQDNWELHPYRYLSCKGLSYRNYLLTARNYPLLYCFVQSVDKVEHTSHLSDNIPESIQQIQMLPRTIKRLLLILFSSLFHPLSLKGLSHV